MIRAWTETTRRVINDKGRGRVIGRAFEKKKKQIPPKNAFTVKFLQCNFFFFPFRTHVSIETFAATPTVRAPMRSIFVQKRVLSIHTYVDGRYWRWWNFANRPFKHAVDEREERRTTMTDRDGKHETLAGLVSTTSTTRVCFARVSFGSVRVLASTPRLHNSVFATGSHTRTPAYDVRYVQSSCSYRHGEYATLPSRDHDFA